VKYKQIIILTILILTIFSLFSSYVYAQVWVIEFSPNLTPVASKISSKIRETYLKDGYGFSSISKYGNKDANKSTAIYKISSGQENIVGFVNTNSSSALKKVGFSSVDDVHTAVAINDIGKVMNAPPITFNSSLEDVIRAMGTPELIQKTPNAFKYRYSYVYFDNDWKVQSWVNKGNLKVSLKDEKKDDFLKIDQSLFNETFKPGNDYGKKKSSTSEDSKTIDEMVEEFLEFLKSQ